MRNEYNGRTCVAVIGSMTQAMRAQSLLAASKIFVDVIKADSSETRHGCAYAISYPCLWQGNVKQILEGAKIRPRSYYEGV